MVDKKNADEFAQGKERLEEIGRRVGAIFGKSDGTPTRGGFFSGLGSLLEQLGTLADQIEKSGGVIRQSGTIGRGPSSRTQGVYGFTVKSAMGDNDVKVEPFGNIRKDDKGKLVEVHEIREPIVDLFDEADRLVIVAEVPGVDPENLHIELQDDILIISTTKGEPKYLKEVLLPNRYSSSKMSFRCRNGVLEIELLKEVS